jgi:hypothetical protein
MIKKNLQAGLQKMQSDLISPKRLNTFFFQGYTVNWLNENLLSYNDQFIETVGVVTAAIGDPDPVRINPLAQ